MDNTPYISWVNLWVSIIPHNEIVWYVQEAILSNIDKDIIDKYEKICKYIQEYYKSIIGDEYQVEDIRITKQQYVGNDTRYFFKVSKKWSEFNGAIMASSILPSYEKSLRFQKSWKSQ